MMKCIGRTGSNSLNKLLAVSISAEGLSNNQHWITGAEVLNTKPLDPYTHVTGYLCQVDFPVQFVRKYLFWYLLGLYVQEVTLHHCWCIHSIRAVATTTCATQRRLLLLELFCQHQRLGCYSIKQAPTVIQCRGPVPDVASTPENWLRSSVRPAVNLDKPQKKKGSYHVCLIMLGQWWQANMQ